MYFFQIFGMKLLLPILLMLIALVLCNKFKKLQEKFENDLRNEAYKLKHEGKVTETNFQNELEDIVPRFIEKERDEDDISLLPPLYVNEKKNNRKF